jgi:large conductance mechanosensitive channel
MLQDFKNFAMKGNVVDLAVGVIIGAAFAKIVDSLVSDVIMPVIGAITGGLDFTNYYVPMSAAIQGHPAYADAKKAGAVLGYGSFLTAVINFLIIAFVLFIAIKQIQRLQNSVAPAEPAAPPPPPRSEVLLEEIRDALVKKQA